MTAAQEAVDRIQKLAEQMWSRATKGVSGAALLRKCLKEPQNWAGDLSGKNSRHWFVTCLASSALPNNVRLGPASAVAAAILFPPVSYHRWGVTMSDFQSTAGSAILESNFTPAKESDAIKALLGSGLWAMPWTASTC